MEHQEVPVHLGTARGEAGMGRSAPGRALIVAARPGGRLDDDSRQPDGSSWTRGILLTGSGQLLISSWWSVAFVCYDDRAVSSRGQAEEGSNLRPTVSPPLSNCQQLEMRSCAIMCISPPCV